MSETYEKLGALYLGKPYGLAQSEMRDELLLYDSKHLLTRGVCFGMSGSGKTGLSICPLEAAGTYTCSRALGPPPMASRVFAGHNDSLSVPS